MNIHHDPEDNDYVAKLLGFEDMAALREQRLAEKRAAAQAALEAETKAREEERLVILAAEDKEINDALQSGRMIVQINGQTFKDVRSYKDMKCGCGKQPSWTREFLLATVWRSTTRGEMHKPLWFRSMAEPLNDTVSAGPDNLRVLAPSLLIDGGATCTECGKPIEVTVECAVEHDGERVSSIRGQ